MKNLVFGIWLIPLLTNQPGLAQDSKTVKAEVLAKTSSSWDGDVLPAYQEGKPEITIVKISIPPKTQLELHKHPVINAGVLLTGEITVRTEDGKVLHLKAGDPIVETVNKWHYGENSGNESAEVIVFYAGSTGTPTVVTKQAATD